MTFDAQRMNSGRAVRCLPTLYGRSDSTRAALPSNGEDQEIGQPDVPNLLVILANAA